MSFCLAFLVDFSIATSLIALFNLSSQKRSFLVGNHRSDMLHDCDGDSKAVFELPNSDDGDLSW
jgi:hypothetical protein